MKRQNRTAILITYFGKTPWYFSFFLQSCQYNKDFDFMMFCDHPVEINVPANLKIFITSLHRVKEMAADKIGFPVSMDYPYKLCDYKPAYGLIFEDYIKDYEFWGQTDIDIIFGELSFFFTDSMLDETDYASVRHDYTTGCFSIFRNNEKVNHLFKKSADYKKVFCSPAYLGFDEMNFRHCEISDKGKSWTAIQTDVECFTQVVKKAQVSGYIRASFDFILLEGTPGKITFNKGQLIYKNEYQCALYHLYWLKKLFQPKRIPAEIPATYHISSTRIYYKKKPAGEV